MSTLLLKEKGGDQMNREALMVLMALIHPINFAAS